MKKNGTPNRGLIYCIKKTMKYSSLIFALICSVGSFTLASGSYGQQLLDVPVTLRLRNASLGEALDKISVQTRVQFVFVGTQHLQKVATSLRVENESLEKVLGRLLTPHGLSYQVVDNRVVIRSIRKSAEADESINAIPPGNLFDGRRPERTAGRIFKEEMREFYRDIEETDVRISGRVIDGKGEPLPGVNIIVKGTPRGMATDAAGRFSMNVPDQDAILVFSFVGYVTQEIKVGNATELEISLKEDEKSLEEVVVIGYGERQRKDLTGAISRITSEEISKQTAMSPEMAMQGRMPGVFIGNPGSGPTARPEVRIRGVGTLGYNDPLYVIDGIPLTEGGAAATAATSGVNARNSDLRGPINVFALINPSDIESISVLKDASATAIYGVRAANGVILITTKRGQEGKAKVDFSARFGVQNLNKRYDVMDIPQYLAATADAWANRPDDKGKPYVPGEPDASLFNPNSPGYLGNSPNYSRDWIENAFVKNAVIQDYNVSVSGGTRKATYSVGAGFANQEDVVYADRFKRYSLSMNSDFKVASWLKLGETFRVIYARNNTAPARPGYSVSFVAPWQPFYDPADPLGYARPGRTVNGSFRANGYGTGSMTQFLAPASLQQNQRDLVRSLGSFYGEVTPFAGFRVRGTYSVDYYTNTRDFFEDQRMVLYNHVSGVINPNAGNIYNRRVSENLNLVKELLIGYNRSFGKHHIDLIANMMDQRVYWNNSGLAVTQRSPIANWDQRRIDEGWPRENVGVAYERNRYGLQGYMGRLSYHFNNKYYLDATIRRDGSSRFAPGYNWGTFPSFAAAWRISEEPFMSRFSGVITDLKLRGGWGRIGNQETRDFAFLSMINVNPKAAFGTNTGENPGNGVIGDAAALLNFPTPNLTWETNNTYNIGFDAEFLSGKFRLSAEYYDRFTDGILQAYPIPSLIGFIGNPVMNLAQVSNRGFEFDGGYNQAFGDVNFNFGFNLTTVRNRVLRLFNDVPVGAESNRVQVGQSINSIFGYKTDGIFRTQAEVDAFLATTKDPGYVAFKGPGDIRYVDFAGAPDTGSPASQFNKLTPDGTVNNFDQTIIGKTIPGFYYGINMGADYRNFDLSIFLRGTGDVQKTSSNGLLSIGGAGGNYLVDYLDRWTPSNPSATIPRAIQGDPSGNNRFSDRFVHNAGFIRLQNVQLGYTLPKEVANKIGFSSARLTATGTNLFVISGFPDLDPENITTPTSFILGLNLGF